MARLIMLFNHTLTSQQKNDAAVSLGVTDFISMPVDIGTLWGQIPAHLVEINKHLQPVRQWLAKNAMVGDYVLIQGDFGATHLLVNYAMTIHLHPVYATTARKVVEQRQVDGSVKMERVFNHIQFRKYEKRGERS